MVQGAISTPRAGIEVLTARLAPVGKSIQRVKNGLCPCTMAHGVHLRNQTSCMMSPQAQLTMLCDEPGHWGQ